MFTKFKHAMQQHFHSLLAQSQQVLYRTDVDKEVLWNAYLASFPEELRQEHNCNACKSFIRHYGGMVAIIDNKVNTIWDFHCEDPIYDTVAQTLRTFVRASPVVDVFVTRESNLGIDKNREMQHDGSVTKWDHIYLELPRTMIAVGSSSVDTIMSKIRDNRNVFKRGLDEITMDAVNTVIELIAQNSLYRGADYTPILNKFKGLKFAYDLTPTNERENYAWDQALRHQGPVAQIKNTAIGTLLIDISEGKELDQAVGAFERIMAPTNYKRPNAIITQRMIDQAELDIEGLGYAGSLGRRFATIDDININNLLFVDRSIRKQKGLLGQLKDDTPVNPKSLSRVEEISAAAFFQDVLPKVTSIEVLFENKHINNLMSLIAARNAEAPTMFKWPNTFSWSYKNAVTDSIKEKVKSAGGRVEGELRVSLEWYNFDDLDLWVIEPGGHKIFYGNKLSPTGGHLDVDMNAGSGTTREAVENIIWPTKSEMKEGTYKVVVNQFNSRETLDVGFSVEIECRGEVLQFSYDKRMRTNENIVVAQLNYSKANGLVLLSSDIAGKSKVNSKKVWNIDTNRFHKVSMIMESPNQWSASNGIGNAHFFFIIDQAHNDEVARGFFNEFLKPELEAHKRVFEALGSRSKVEPADKQVTGLGFSITQSNDFIVKVEGSFSRTLKIKF